ncbi:MAG: SDR family NAD(P)-dependent oxidoreductase [Chloroflexota bacterium]
MSERPVVLITGAAGGIGAATAQVFRAAGWHVIGTDVAMRDGLRLDRSVTCDIADEAENAALFESVAATEGRLDALVNNAALQIAKPLTETTTADWDAVMNVNVRAVYLAIRHAHALLRASQGAIVNVSSVHAVATSANIAVYAASKGALTALTRAVAIELAQDGIRVNAVQPGAVDTPMLRAGLRRGHLAGTDDVELLAALGARHVIGRVGQPTEIGEAILFLADRQRSGFMTGQALTVDGGATIRLSTE